MRAIIVALTLGLMGATPIPDLSIQAVLEYCLTTVQQEHGLSQTDAFVYIDIDGTMSINTYTTPHGRFLIRKCMAKMGYKVGR